MEKENDYPLSYRLLGCLVLSFMTLYAFIALYAEFFGHKEITHFFSWFVFTRVPQKTQREFGVRVLEYQNKKFNPPVFLNDSGVTFSTRKFTTPEYSRRIYLLGQSVESKNEKQIELARSEMEAVFLPGAVSYEVVEIVFDPVERWKNGKITEVRSLASFKTQVIQ